MAKSDTTLLVVGGLGVVAVGGLGLLLFRQAQTNAPANNPSRLPGSNPANDEADNPAQQPVAGNGTTGNPTQQPPVTSGQTQGQYCAELRQLVSSKEALKPRLESEMRQLTSKADEAAWCVGDWYGCTGPGFARVCGPGKNAIYAGIMAFFRGETGEPGQNWNPSGDCELRVKAAREQYLPKAAELSRINADIQTLNGQIASLRNRGVTC